MNGMQMHHDVAYEITGRQVQAGERARQQGRNPRRPMNVLQRAGMDCTRRAIALETEIAALAGSLRAQKARFLQLVGEYDVLGGWIASGAISCAHWLADLLDIELSTAREQVRVARALRDLPAVADAVATGALSYAKAREITRVATVDTETELLALAQHAPAGALARQLANWQTAREPERLSERQWAARSCMFRQEADGTVTISLRLPPEVAARVRAELDVAAMAVLRTSDGESRSLTQARTDAAVIRMTTSPKALSNDAPAGASLPTPRRSSSTGVEVILHRRIDHSEIDGVTLAPSTAARLCCDAAIRVMLHHPDGSPADVGRRQRLVTPRLRRLVEERDRRCTYPGCAATAFLDVHHVLPWEHGGPTNLANLTLLCGYHHRRLHDDAPAGAPV
ncbi:MAG: DUF222 domain-containing protein [Acidimicrobiia bacterium]